MLWVIFRGDSEELSQITAWKKFGAMLLSGWNEVKLQLTSPNKYISDSKHKVFKQSEQSFKMR